MSSDLEYEDTHCAWCGQKGKHDNCRMSPTYRDAAMNTTNPSSEIDNDVVNRACDAYESECGLEVSFFGMKAALSAAHHARKLKER